uniref:Uncharacterized protein n=1 Tax=Solanum lycopersicum TaxID=4081 RepID=A0A3Q7EPP6_SOLLC
MPRSLDNFAWSHDVGACLKDANHSCESGLKLPKSHLRQVHKEFHDNTLQVIYLNLVQLRVDMLSPSSLTLRHSTSNISYGGYEGRLGEWPNIKALVSRIMEQIPSL